MRLIELKQAVSRLTNGERRELFAYMVWLKHDTPEWKRTTARRLGEMKRGKAVSAEVLAVRVGNR